MYDLLSNLIRTFARTLDLGFRIHVVVTVQPFMFYVRVKDDAVTLGRSRRTRQAVSISKKTEWTGL